MSKYGEAKNLYQHALNNKYILPAFNCFDVESMKAIVGAAIEQDSPVVLQLCMAMREKVRPMDKFVRYLLDYISDVPIPVILNHDHMQTFEQCKEAVDMGMHAIMFDGSSLPFEENVQRTSAIVEYAHSRGVWVEAELGSIPGFEDMVFSDKSIYTVPEQAAEFVERTGCDSLSVAVGTAHGGVKTDRPLSIDFDLLDRIHSAVGVMFPLVLHGAASLPSGYIDEVNSYGGKVERLMMCPESVISESRLHGVAKANMDVDNFLKYTYTVRKIFCESPELFNPFEYNSVASAAMKEACAHKMRTVTLSAGLGHSFISEQN